MILVVLAFGFEMSTFVLVAILETMAAELVSEPLKKEGNTIVRKVNDRWIGATIEIPEELRCMEPPSSDAKVY